MQDTDVRDALQAYVSEQEPPMRLSAGDVLKAGRRAHRVRRTGALATGVAASVLVVSGVAVIAPRLATEPETAPAPAASPDGFAPARPCAEPPGPRPTGSFSASRAFTEDQAKWAADSLTCHLGTTMPRLLPDARYGKDPGRPAGALTAFSWNDGPPWNNRVDATALVRDAEGTSHLNISVGVAGPEAADEVKKCRLVKFCSVRTGPDGETVLLNQAKPDPGSGVIDINAIVFRGHTYVWVEVINSDRQSVDGGGPVATRPTPVLTAEQVVELALSPELYLFP